ncbi:MAG TPA: carbohydrate porin [Steroidobacteraceae bacterium]|nr:carbohydrate porin [Steroidobacteraceae bacterium]
MLAGLICAAQGAGAGAADGLASGAESPPAATGSVAATGGPAVAADASPSAADEQRFAVHAQATYVDQQTNDFRSPYHGPNSLTAGSGRESTDLTLFLGARPWRGAEIWINPEMDQGFGLDDTLGLAAFSSGAAYKVGSDAPYFRLQRAFIRQTIDTGGGRENVQGTANQLAGPHSLDRWVLTVGKISVPDIFDTNQYAHDPRNDFFNWAAIDAGTFDYAADSWGYTVGAAAERYLGSWTYRAGVFDLSTIPNSADLEPGLHELQADVEIEKRYGLLGQTGRALLTVFYNRARMALLDQAIALGLATGTPPDPADVRQYHSRMGVSFDLEQPITDDAGLFARVGKAGGNTEVYEFTDIDRAVAVGGSLQGLRWHRPDDTIGVALLDDGISAEREEYLNLGGLGILVGDGKLPHPGAEQVLETYYRLGALSWLHVSLDYQYVKNPAYNRDRGPVSIYGVRVHAQF